MKNMKKKRYKKYIYNVRRTMKCNENHETSIELNSLPGIWQPIIDYTKSLDKNI